MTTPASRRLRLMPTFGLARTALGLGKWRRNLGPMRTEDRVGPAALRPTTSTLEEHRTGPTQGKVPADRSLLVFKNGCACSWQYCAWVGTAAYLYYQPPVAKANKAWSRIQLDFRRLGNPGVKLADGAQWKAWGEVNWRGRQTARLGPEAGDNPRWSGFSRKGSFPTNGRCDYPQHQRGLVPAAIAS
jgi:hypothetical protein